jgi:radical SAM superfamily enzyme YgiQ (UPF0313 family)
LNTVLVSTYELGRQPFGLASPAAWLRRAGSSVTCLDLSRQALDEDAIRAAHLIAFYTPMHTATRLAIQTLPVVQKLNPEAYLCFYGLYAPMNESFLRKLGAQAILGGEFEEGLVATLERLKAGNNRPEPQRLPVISLSRQTFLTPERSGLPVLARYARLVRPDGSLQVAGYTEASRGCKHLCRHCPVVPVYNGRFRIVQPEVVLEDIRRQVRSGASHITFGDPDFFNGIRHAVEIVTSMHAEHSNVTYDATIKIEHLLKHAEHLKTLRDTGCLFVTSAVESLDNQTLSRLNKGHTCQDFLQVLGLFRDHGLRLSPTFVTFTPWTTLEGYCEFLTRLQELDLVEQIAPIQLGIRLLIPAGSRLLELSEMQDKVGPFDERALVYPWSNPDRRVDELCTRIQELVRENEGVPRRTIFSRVAKLAYGMAGTMPPEAFEPRDRLDRAAVPYLTEPWYC